MSYKVCKYCRHTVHLTDKYSGVEHAFYCLLTPKVVKDRAFLRLKAGGRL